MSSELPIAGSPPRIDPAARVKNRRPWLAFVLSLGMPGLGHVYNTELKRGLLFVAGWVGLFLLLALLVQTPPTHTAIVAAGFVLLGFAIVLTLYAAVDATLRARRLGTVPLRRFNRIAVYLAFYVLWSVAGAAVAEGLKALGGQEYFTIPAGSMAPTLVPGDCIVAWKGYYADHPVNYGDVAVFRLPSDPEVDYVKRIVGLPGDRIQMKGGRLYINDTVVPRQRLDDDFISDIGHRHPQRHARYVETMPNGREHIIVELSDSRQLDDTDAFRVPSGHVFVLGDNRDNSADSRVTRQVGFVPIANLKGYATHIYWSKDRDRIGTQIQTIP